jgi:hypothetical protein
MRTTDEGSRPKTASHGRSGKRPRAFAASSGETSASSGLIGYVSGSAVRPGGADGRAAATDAYSVCSCGVPREDMGSFRAILYSLIGSYPASLDSPGMPETR